SYSPRVILSGSMMPVMNIGDVVILHTIPGSEAKLGDIVMFPVGSMKVTHRIIDVEETEEGRYFTTKGDANGEPESDLLAEQDVQGKVVMIIPKLGYATLWLRGAWN
ncbi:MAG TPA: signal peptidase I, partial [Peptococcaceae bacterium]|nr:signal peptidase I [Peptococcaceae bacterium]